MALIRKNLITLFLIILTISTIILSSLIYKITKDAYINYEKKQENLTKITANSINSLLIQYEMLFDVLGSQLLKNNSYLNVSTSKELFDNLLKVNPGLSAFALVRKNGEIYISSGDSSRIHTYLNLAKLKETKETFIKAVNSNNMIVGRTYFSKDLNTLVIPVRKALRDKNGNVLAVMTAVMKVDKLLTLLSNTQSKTIIIRGFDRYLQLLNYKNKKDLENFYKVQVPSEHLELNIQKAQNKYNKNIDYFKEKEEVFTVDYKALITKKEVMASIKYIKKYQLWIITQIEKSVINKEISNSLIILISIYLVVILIFYILFKNLNENEEKKEKALLYQARHDHLTGLNNRLYLSENFLEKKNLEDFSLLFIDLDNFKVVNDNYGHSYGDTVLINAAKRLLSFKKEKDSLIRFSGDEFLLIKHITNKEEIEYLANRVLKKLSEPYLIEGYKFIVGASIGIAQYPKDGKCFDDVKRHADMAMYESKKDKNSFRFFEDSIKDKYLKSAQIEQELKKAIINDEIYLVYQPQITKEGKLFGVEALVRWENETLGFIPPDEFIKVAEATGHMIKLGRFIMEKAIKDIKEIQSLTNQFFYLSINISVKQFMDEDFYDKLNEYIEENQFDKKYLTLEVTENVFIEDLEYILTLLNKIKEDNIKISLDDFGTGYSSLNILKKLPMEELKIDKSFVDDILVDEASKNMIRSIISIGKKFKLETVAEGIETKQQKELLDLFGCKLYQGYYFSKPLKKQQLIEFIQNN